MTREVVTKLREISSLKVGDPWPAWLNAPNGWAEAISKLCGEAADVIEGKIEPDAQGR